MAFGYGFQARGKQCSMNEYHMFSMNEYQMLFALKDKHTNISPVRMQIGQSSCKPPPDSQGQEEHAGRQRSNRHFIQTHSNISAIEGHRQTIHDDLQRQTIHDDLRQTIHDDLQRQTMHDDLQQSLYEQWRSKQWHPCDSATYRHVHVPRPTPGCCIKWQKGAV